MSTNKSSSNILLQITLCKTDKPTVNRMLSVPFEMNLTELHEAIAAAFGWSIEPCTSWVFNVVDQDPLIVTKGDNANKLKTTFTAFWTAPDQGYNVTPAEHGTHLAVGLCMREAQLEKYWTYDYNISKQPHAVTVIGTLTHGQAPKLTCLGGFGNISRKTWQLASLVGNGAKVKAGGCSWVSGMEALGVELGEIQEKFEERKKVEANLAAKPKTKSNKRAAPSGSKSAGAIRCPTGLLKSSRLTRSGKLLPETKVTMTDPRSGMREQ